MIDVKGTRTVTPGTTESYEHYVLKNADKRSSAPAFFTVLLTGLALYLKSAFPSLAGAQPAEPEDAAGEPTPTSPEVVPSSAPDPGPVAEGFIQEADGPKRSGERSFAYREPNDFMPSDLPAFEFQNLKLPSFELLKRMGGITVSFPAANDNAWTAKAGANSAGGSNHPGGFAPERENAAATPDGDDLVEEETGDERNPDGKAANRACRTSGPIYLLDVYGCAMTVIGLADLLRGAWDPDGDALKVQNITVSSGDIKQTADGWLFDPSTLGPVTISYQITDGEFSVAQTAMFNVLTRPPVVGTPGDDVVLGTDCADDIDGRDGDDNIDSRSGSDTVLGGAGSDHIVAGSGNDVVFAGVGNDIVLGGAGDDQLWGGDGDDRLFGDAGRDVIFGEAGNDTISGGDDDDMLFGGGGADVVAGEGGNDLLAGDDGDDRLDGGDGNDIVFGEAGSDVIDGGEGDDFLAGGAGEDVVRGGDGNDMVAGDADLAADTYDGGQGVDMLDYSASLMSLVVDLAAASASGSEIGNDRITNFEVVKGGDGNDTITGGSDDDTLIGNGGDDCVSDGQGDDNVSAGAGNDLVLAAADSSDDCYRGEAGFDTLDYSDAAHGVLIDLTSGIATGFDVGRDVIDGFEQFIGGSGDDAVLVSTAAVVLSGGEGADTFNFQIPKGSSGAEVIHQILDFMVGDRIEMSKYQIFEEVLDSLEDRFEDAYGEDAKADVLPIRVRHQGTGELEETLVEVDMDQDDHFEMTINLSGHHLLMIVENA
jgi:Ca2+-binding RTX toxin-like protein